MRVVRSWKGRCGLALTTALLVVAVMPGGAEADAHAADGTATREAGQNPWCAPELESVGSSNCYWLASKGAPLVIFLHGLTGVGGTWHWDQQRMYVRLAKQHQFSALIPRGRRGVGPGRDPDVLGWPNSQRAQSEVEADVLAQLADARKTLEQRAGQFGAVFVFGFSAGAYYATSLMLREKIDVDGFAAFAGGSGNEYQALQAKRVKRRIPMFLGYGKKDPDRKRQQELANMLASLKWPHRVVAANIGHTVTNEQVEEALEFLLQTAAPKVPAQAVRP
jgi:predicted esterase